MSLKKNLHEIIFEAETRAGKNFDVVLIIVILASVIVTMLETVDSVRIGNEPFFVVTEIFFTLFFTLEYLLRIYCSLNTRSYMLSFFGLIDLISTLPFYLGLLLPGAQSLSIVRGLRILRIFRVLKLNQYALAGQQLNSALRQSWPKIFVFLITIITSVSIMGALIYLVEGKEYGFTSIPKGVYWAVVTMTTVGYGDLAPQTPLGQFMSVVLMILGYGVIAVPTGIVSAELVRDTRVSSSTRTCPNCFLEGHEKEALFCRSCGSRL
ncbi:MAG: ion transporter [Pseudomonadota bacterium]